MHRRLFTGPGPERGGGNSDDNLPPGAFVGIAIGAVCFVAFFVLLAYFCLKKRRDSLAQTQVEPQESASNTVYSKMGRMGRVVLAKPLAPDYLPPTEPPAAYKESSLDRGIQAV